MEKEKEVKLQKEISEKEELNNLEETDLNNEAAEETNEATEETNEVTEEINEAAEEINEAAEEINKATEETNEAAEETKEASEKVSEISDENKEAIEETSSEEATNKKGIDLNDSFKTIEDKVKKSNLYAQLMQMFFKIKTNDYEFEFTKRDKIISLAIVVGVVFFDQLTKIISSNLLMEYESYEIIDNFFYFTFLYNPGMAWGTLEGMRWLFVFVTPLIMLVVVYFFVYSKKHEILTRGGMILVFAGAIGNWIDRIFIGEVRDFIHFIIPIINYDFPVFNIADIAVVLGMGLVILEIIIQEYQIWKLSKSL